MKRKAIGLSEMAQAQRRLRALLGSPGLRLERPRLGQSVQVLCQGEMVGTVDCDDDGDLIVTIPLLAEELAEAGD